MKITRQQLKALILEEMNSGNSLLLEMPEGSIVGQEQTGDYTKDPSEYGDEAAKRALFHMTAQAQQMHDMIQSNDGLEDWMLDDINKAAKCLERAFKALMYDKQNPEGK
tara:strand:+ start:829 stop:1155 length:327 start_codon:yes stop_codon:yes gene_type:complete